jgi:sporulation protein YlmC with PRC-barrel domain
MAVRLSQMYGMDIYSEEAGYVGKVNDMILNMEAGEVVRLTTVPIKSIVEAEASSEMIQKNSVLYKRVSSVRDIVLIGKIKQ